MGKNLRSRKKICSIKADGKDNENENHLTNDKQTIEVLNDDCLLHIFEYLPISDRIRLERVNKHWLAISRMSWKSFKTLNFTSRMWGTQAIITRKALKDVLLLCGEYLKVLDMSEFSVLRSEIIHIQSALKFCPNLVSVDFTSIIVTKLLIISLIVNCKNIVILNLGTIRLEVNKFLKDGQILSTYKNLQVFNIESKNISTFFVTALSGNWIKFQDNTSIKELRLDCCPGLSLSNLSTVIPQFTNLHILSLRGSLERPSIPWNLNFIERSNIQVLDISNNPIIVDDDFLIRHASVFIHLKSLFMNGNKRVTDNGLRSAVLLSKLEYLDIDELNIEGSSLSDLPYLKELSCRRCPRLEVEHVQFFFDQSDRLESIDLREYLNKSLFKIMVAARNSTDSRTNGIRLRMYVDKYFFVFNKGLNMILEH